MSKPTFAALLLFNFLPVLRAQPPAPAQSHQPGVVTGHVFCADTQRPARLAKVALLAAPTGKALTGKAKQRDEEIGSAPATDYVETALDGSFIIADVKPGEYYMIVDQDGYTLPLAEFARKDLASSDPDTRARIVRQSIPISVRSGATLNQEVRLERGASVSGTVTYDDGSPAGGLGVNILTKDSKGKWVSGIISRYRSGFGRIITNDQGHYRVSGLPPGEYVTQIDLTLSQYTTTTSHPPDHPDQVEVMRMQRTRYSLPLFSGNALRQTAAVPYKLGAAEERGDGDLQFPLSKLHRVTGQVVTRSGHVLNSGSINLLNVDDSSKVTEAQVDPADNLFHLEFVPEGDFIVKVSGARDTVKVQIANPPGTVPRVHDEEKTLATYGDAQQPLTIGGETQGVLITVPEAGQSGAASPGTAQ